MAGAQGGKADDADQDERKAERHTEQSKRQERLAKPIAEASIIRILAWLTRRHAGGSSWPRTVAISRTRMMRKAKEAKAAIVAAIGASGNSR